MEDDACNMDDFMNEMQDTTHSGEMSISSNAAPVLDQQSPACNAANGVDAHHDAASLDDETPLSESESVTEIQDKPDSEIFERFPDRQEEEESHEIATSSFSDGYNVGEMLLAMSLGSVSADGPTSFETTIAGVKYKLVHYINLNKLEQKTKKLFNLEPEQTPPLFGYRHYFGLLNSYDSRGYVARCPLAYTPTKEEVAGGIVSNCFQYVLMDILETRCWREEYHLAVYVVSQKEVQIIRKEGLQWLRDNRLECRPDLSFDVEEVEK